MPKRLQASSGTKSATREGSRGEIEAIIARYASAHANGATAVPGLSVARLTAPMPANTVFYEPSLCMCIRGAKRMVIGDTVVVQDEHHFAICSLDLPMVVAIDDASPRKPYTALLIKLDLDIAREMIASIAIDGHALTANDTGMARGVVTDDLMDVVLRVVRLLERPSDVGVMGPLLQREILFRLLAGSNGERLREIVRVGSASQRVAKAIDWLKTHYTERLRIDALARRVGMGVSTLHRHFQEATMMSPLQYQKQLRLHAARRLMLSDDVDAGSAALHVGYESVTQFNREYRRLFGEPPRRDINALRALGGRALTLSS